MGHGATAGASRACGPCCAVCWVYAVADAGSRTMAEVQRCGREGHSVLRDKEVSCYGFADGCGYFWWSEFGVVDLAADDFPPGSVDDVFVPGRALCQAVRLAA